MIIDLPSIKTKSTSDRIGSGGAREIGEAEAWIDGLCIHGVKGEAEEHIIRIKRIF